MNWDQVKGEWKQLKGSMREQWAKLTDDDLESVAGDRDKLVGKIQERYGYEKERAHKFIDEAPTTPRRATRSNPAQNPADSRPRALAARGRFRIRRPLKPVPGRGLEGDVPGTRGLGRAVGGSGLLAGLGVIC
jgi:uncharacterized protein YjbJ (UPF0337 family)